MYQHLLRHRVGLYEKALPNHLSWEENWPAPKSSASIFWRSRWMKVTSAAAASIGMMPPFIHCTAFVRSMACRCNRCALALIASFRLARPIRAAR